MFYNRTINIGTRRNTVPFSLIRSTVTASVRRPRGSRLGPF